ncbi:metal ABC transporter solute-binding protein, Zn/Mn family [Massilibacterium senegalense]|uniref:metal ABC transporter solute-binding protein, Zn/Mn family n=1 Tax=Massilibacterium senegalense TaxID=1632858 RepID=UPI000780C750|nr:zinc ABC transporter substrate-binding protein [Massilibacterium senegalense]
MFRKYGLSAFALFSALILILAGCSSKENKIASKDSKDKIVVYTALYPLQYFTERIGGEYVEVNNMMPFGGDAHTFEPTSKELTKVAEADLFIESGGGIEMFVEKLEDSMKNENVTFVTASKGIQLLEVTADSHAHEGKATTDEHGHENEATEEDEHEGHNHGNVDPHVWLDPIFSIDMAENIKNELVKKQPEQKEVFEKNFASLKTDLQNIDENFKKVTEEADQKAFIVSHKAYGYWANRYGLEQIGIAGLSSTNEPSQKQLTEIIEIAKEKDIKYVIYEQNVTPKVAKVIETEIGAKTLRLHNLASLTEEDYKEKKDYVALMNENIETMKTALTK